jgi:thioesterase domain-containing protein
MRFARNFRYWLKDFRRLKAEDRRHFYARKLRALGRKITGRFRGRGAQVDMDLEEMIDLRHFSENELKLWDIHLRALTEHVEHAYSGDVVLLRTRGQSLWCSLEEDFCWSKLVRGNVAVKIIPGSHENIFVEPNVKCLATELEACLASARAASEKSGETTSII